MRPSLSGGDLGALSGLTGEKDEARSEACQLFGSSKSKVICNGEMGASLVVGLGGRGEVGAALVEVEGDRGCGSRALPPNILYATVLPRRRAPTCATRPQQGVAQGMGVVCRLCLQAGSGACRGRVGTAARTRLQGETSSLQRRGQANCQCSSIVISRGSRNHVSSGDMA